MNINLIIPNYDGNALDVIWGENAHYSIHTYENQVVLSANKDGLISLAKQMLYMAYNDLPYGSHVHFDSFFTKSENNANDLIIELEHQGK